MTAARRKILTYSVITAVALLFVLAAGVGMKESSIRTFPQGDRVSSVNFSHANHVTERGIECADCHTLAPGSTISSDYLLPDHQSCESCHSDRIEEDCAYCHVNPDDISPSVSPVRELTFSHKTHVGTARISCKTCHGSILEEGSDGTDDENVMEDVGGLTAESYLGIRGTGDHLPKMEMCVTCHLERGIPQGCETCHFDFVSLVPENHLVSGFNKEHRRAVRVGEMDVSCQTCHQESYCQECHSGDQLRGFGTAGGLMSVPGARGALRETPDELRLQAAHDLNYRFTHSIDARARVVDCTSCHNQQTFCAECHQAGGVLQGAIKPQSHFDAGFVMVGAATGGGRHAELGRRDIESCVSCHDVEGADPTCILCHSGR